MVSRDRLVPIKLLNPTKDKIELYKGKTLATFSEITSEHLLIPFNDNSKHSVQNTNLVPNTVENIDIASDNGSTTCTNETDVREFGSNFDLDHSEMDDSQITALQHFLYDNKDMFVTKQSPDLEFTDLVFGTTQNNSATQCQTEIPKTISFVTGQERGTTASS